MNVNYINCIISAFTNTMPKIGMVNISKRGMEVKGKNINSLGVAIVISFVGDLKGNIIYTMTEDSAKSIASKMMMGKPVTVLDDMSKSALSEMINMITGNASTNFSDININIDISPPAFFHGNSVISTSTEKVLSLQMLVDDIKLDVNISLE